MTTSKMKLHPVLQKAAVLWPIIGAAAGLLAGAVTGAFGAVGQLNANTADIRDTKARVTTLEQRIPDIRTDLAVIKQQGADNADALEHIQNRMDAQDRRSSK